MNRERLIELGKIYRSVSVANWAGRQMVLSLINKVSPQSPYWTAEAEKTIKKLRKVCATAFYFDSDAVEYWVDVVIQWIKDVNHTYKTENDIKWALLCLRHSVDHGWVFETKKG